MCNNIKWFVCVSICVFICLAGNGAADSTDLTKGQPHRRYIFYGDHPITLLLKFYRYNIFGYLIDYKHYLIFNLLMLQP